MTSKYQRFFNMILITVDALTLAAAYAAAYLFKSGQPFETTSKSLHFIGLLWMIPLIIAVYYIRDVYTPMRNTKFRKEALLIARAHLIGMVFVYSVFFLNKGLVYSRAMLLMFGALGLIFMLSQRSVVRKILRSLRKSGFNQKNMLIIGAGKAGVDFARKVKEHKDFGYNVMGFLDEREDERRNQESSIMGIPVFGNHAMLPELLENQVVDEVVVALPLNAYRRYGDIIDACEKEGVRVRIIPDYSEFLPTSSKVEEFDGIPLLNIRHIPLDDPFNRSFKRIFDILVSLLAIILTGPLMLFIAIGIILTSKGPIFFKQERVGRNNRPFDMLKFRSMRVADDNTAATVWTTADDPRKTKFGTFLRKSSLDELPQFFNVLFGDMSVSGPRPERPFFVEQFKEQIPKYMVKHQVKPGITGWAQVNGWRGDTSIEKRIECDIYYIENWDMLFDIKIMFLTVFKGLVNKNAY